MLGFDGIVLALLLQGAGLKGIDPSTWTWTFLVPALAALVLTGWFALRALAPTDVQLPNISQFRGQWSEFHPRPEPGTMGPQIAESLLNSLRPHEESTTSSAKNHADRRASELTRAVRSLFIALVLLTALLLNLLTHAWKA